MAQQRAAAANTLRGYVRRESVDGRKVNDGETIVANEQQTAARDEERRKEERED